jgi:GNAT superfamily N-acetyltransferase
MIVRVANKNDVSGLRKLDAKETIFVKELNEFHTVLDDNEFLNFFLETKNVFIAESGSVIVGFLIAQIREWIFHYKKIIWIEHIFGDPERRKEGIAQSILNYMINHYTKNDPDIEFINKERLM